jgi:hypothetical protein
VISLLGVAFLLLLADAAAAGIELSTITGELEREGVQAFCDSYHRLLDCIENKTETVADVGG